jgi:uncharacterized protein (UPF0276 family)
MAQLGEIVGAGLGLKRELIPQLKAQWQTPALQHLQFVEIAPENWIDAGGKFAAELEWFAERIPIACHGLCLSLGGADPLNIAFLKQVRQFLTQYQIPLYTEHLSYCSDANNGYIYDLLPIPFTEEAVRYVAKRIQQTQEILGQRIAVENASFYVKAPISSMDEITFVNAVLTEADCDLHLDINNVYVNSVNFGFDPLQYLDKIPAERIVYSHIAGHLQVEKNLLVDTHGENVIHPVWDLLDYAYQKFGVFPTLLERDTNIPSLLACMQEVDEIAAIQQRYARQRK